MYSVQLNSCSAYEYFHMHTDIALCILYAHWNRNHRFNKPYTSMYMHKIHQKMCPHFLNYVQEISLCGQVALKLVSPWQLMIFLCMHN